MVSLGLGPDLMYRKLGGPGFDTSTIMFSCQGPLILSSVMVHLSGTHMLPTKSNTLARTSVD